MHPPKVKTVKNPDGSFKTIEQLMKSSMTVLKYGQFLAATQQKAVNRG